MARGSPKSSFAILGLRIAAGILALLSFGLMGIRLAAYSGMQIQMGPEAFMHSLRVLFPLSVGLIFGYMAVTGKMPFVDDKDREP